MKSELMATVLCGTVLDAIKNRQFERFGYVRITPEYLRSTYHSSIPAIKFAEDLRKALKEADYQVDVKIEYDIDLDTDERMWLVSWGPGTGKVENH